MAMKFAMTLLLVTLLVVAIQGESWQQQHQQQLQSGSAVQTSFGSSSSSSTGPDGVTTIITRHTSIVNGKEVTEGEIRRIHPDGTVTVSRLEE